MNWTKRYLPPSLPPAALSSGPSSGFPCSSGALASHLPALQQGVEAWPLLLPPHFAGVPHQLQKENIIDVRFAIPVCCSCPFASQLLQSEVQYQCCFPNERIPSRSHVGFFSLHSSRYVQVAFPWLSGIIHWNLLICAQCSVQQNFILTAVSFATVYRSSSRESYSYLLLMLFDMTEHTHLKNPQKTKNDHTTKQRPYPQVLKCSYLI